MIKLCPVCNKEFEVSSKHKNQVYCSRKCAGITQRKTTETKCDYCGKLFYKPISQTRGYEKHFCSNECRYKANRQTNVIYYENDYAYMLLEKDDVILKVLFDVDDVDKVNQYKWHLHLRERDMRYDVCTNTYYDKDKKRVYLNLARFLMNCPQNLTIDHINRNPLDNRRKNLRICTQFINNLNKGNNTSGCVGVTWDKSKNKWRTFINAKYLGHFDDFEDAAKCRKEAERLYQSQNL